MASHCCFPDLCVLDLDATMWTPETCMLHKVPTRQDVVRGPLGGGVGEGVVALKCGNSTMRLIPSAREFLQHVHEGRFPYMRLAAASTAVDRTSVAIAHAAMGLFEVVPGVTMLDVLNQGWEEGFSGHIQVGRQAPLTPDKATCHFPRIRGSTSIPYDRMVFFDDCIWDDHCRIVAKKCPGVITRATPDGCSMDHFHDACREYASRHGDRPTLLSSPVQRD